MVLRLDAARSPVDVLIIESMKKTQVNSMLGQRARDSEVFPLLSRVLAAVEESHLPPLEYATE